ncbi:hypothetical protein J2W43_000641 [Pseudomonas brassicacearum]|uniref:Uncharacterized protein n=1 Tax=Pseudomonas brassicacearum TaxID=930166 RepID=A0AAW8M5I9_9PSED|nr:hypothetical protein [Pseudomonas brassicacearum]MDR6956678.1 hypothetical protein [Pseudomonas brassicacearum]
MSEEQAASGELQAVSDYLVGASDLPLEACRLKLFLKKTQPCY